MKSVTVLVLVATSFVGSRAAAQDTRPLVDEPELHYFDFWAGTTGRTWQLRFREEYRRAP